MFIIKRCTAKISLNYINRCKTIVRMSSEGCIVAVCQLTSTNNKENNLKSVKRVVAEAANKCAKIVFLPEACDYVGKNKAETKVLSEPLTGNLINEYKCLAKQYSVWLSIGGFHERLESSTSNFKLRNAHVLINDHGEIVSVYRKLHLYDVSIPEKQINLKESDMVESGSELVPPIKTPAGSLALSICYDLRFPEISTLLRKQGADILTYPSAFTNATGEAHWEVLLRARAIENQCYVVAAAQYGEHNESRISYGHAMIVDPWGKIVAACPKYNESERENESVAVAIVQPNLIKKFRIEMPVFQHRRDDIYDLKAVNSDQLPVYDRFHFADKVIPASTVFLQTKYCYAFTNIRCVVPGHVLVSTIRVARRLEDLTQDEIADLFQTAVKVEKVLERVYSAKSTTLTVQDGKYAGQTMPHVHVHVMPRKPGDFENNDDIYEKLAKHDKQENADPLRSVEEMAEEAGMLRQYFMDSKNQDLSNHKVQQ